MSYFISKKREPVKLTGRGPNGKGRIAFAFTPDRMRRVNVPDRVASLCAEDLARLIDSGALIVPTEGA